MKRLFLCCVVPFVVLACSSTVTEITLDENRRVTKVERLTPDDSWKRTEEQRIEAELAGKRPEGGVKTWREYWRSSYVSIRRDPGPPPWKPTEFKSGDDMVRYIETRRRARGLPPYD